MPSIKVEKLAGGSVNFNYTIATPPTSTSSPKFWEKKKDPQIDPKLPTVLFFHPVYISQEIFTYQFGDPQIRRFNLVSVDMRLHGGTKGKVPKNFNQEMAAEDMARFMEKLKLPACHIFAVSLGTIVALQLAVSYPHLVSSLFFVSPLGIEESQNAAEGRQAIYDAWVEGWRDGKPNQEDLGYAINGALELAWYDRTCSIAQALIKTVIPTAMKNWDASHLDEYRVITLDIFLNRRSYPAEELRRIKVPVKLIHGLEDVAYPLKETQIFLHQLQDAGVNASLNAIPGGPHFCCVENHDSVNAIFHSFMKDIAPPVPDISPEAAMQIVSPWEKNGWIKSLTVIDADSDEE